MSILFPIRECNITILSSAGGRGNIINIIIYRNYHLYIMAHLSNLPRIEKLHGIEFIFIL